MPDGQLKTPTFVVALRLSGMTAPIVLDGPMNGTWLLADVQQVRAPPLKPGDVVITATLSGHKRTPIRDAIEAVDAQLLLPPHHSADRSLI